MSSVLRGLSVAYVATASVFVVALALQHNPTWAPWAYGTGKTGAAAVSEHVLKPGWRFAGREWRQGWSALKPVLAAHGIIPAEIPPHRPPPDAFAQRGVAHAVAPRAQPFVAPTASPRIVFGVAQLSPLDAPKIAEAERTDTPHSVTPEPAPTPAEVARVADHLQHSLSPELTRGFELFLYVSKAEQGPWAQRMYVFQKSRAGVSQPFALLHAWPVSTGSETPKANPDGKILATHTPEGYYQLDGNRFYAHYRSHEWGHKMPYAMFFNWEKNGNQTGLAIHGADGAEIALLGRRASAGCVRLAPDHAEQLFRLIRGHYKASVPQFAYDKRTGTMANDGRLARDANGRLKMAEGYKVLVFIENYGGSDIVATLD